jgi:uncharacterized protein (DUF1800 family)
MIATGHPRHSLRDLPKIHVQVPIMSERNVMKTILVLPRFITAVALVTVGIAPAQERKPSPIEVARAAVEKAVAEKAEAEKILADRAVAAKGSAEKMAAAKAAAEKAAAEAKVAEKAAAEKAAPEKTLTEKTAALRKAEETVLAEEAFAADEAVTRAMADKAAADKALTDKATAAKKAADEVIAAKSTAEKGAKEKTTAEQSLAKKTKAATAALEKLNETKAGATTEGSPEIAAAKRACEKAATEKAAAEKLLDEKSSAAKAAADKCASAQIAAEKAAAAQAETEKLVPQKAAAITAALDKQAAARATLLGGLKPLTASAWDYDKARHLLNRAGFGGTPDEVAKLHAMGLHRAVEHLVEFQKLPSPNAHVDVRLPERATPYENRLTPTERSKLENARTSRRFQQESQLRQWWLRRMVETQRPLEEKLALFWHGHFAVSFLKNENPHAMFRQNQLFREYGGVNYAGLLRGIAQDPAMITYLDNQVNFKGSGNENLGREILELFSMGEGQGYSEQDLREASRALTGYSHDHWTGQFKFVATRHDETSKSVFGKSGNWGGDDLVDLILQQPSTARFISAKVFQYFAHETPSAETIDRLANTLRLCHYELAPMLENLFLSEEFYSEQAMCSRIKSPAELMVGTIRALGLTQVDYAAMDNALQRMGQTLFEPPNVKGWEEGRAWINANRVLIRYNEVANLVENSSLDLVAILDGKGIGTPAQVVDHFARSCLALPLSDEKRKVLINFLDALPPCAQWADKRKEVNARLRALLVALLTTPEYQLSQNEMTNGEYLMARLAVRVPDCVGHSHLSLVTETSR